MHAVATNRTLKPHREVNHLLRRRVRFIFLLQIGKLFVDGFCPVCAVYKVIHPVKELGFDTLEVIGIAGRLLCLVAVKLAL